MDPLTHRVAARYKQKKVVDSEDGGKTTVYLYSERQIARRNAEKAKRLEKLTKSIGDLRAKVKRDLKSSDPERYLTALAVALIDHTYERVGNEGSAKEREHFGVTGWQKRHVSFGKGNATIKYTGKSGVQQTKKVTDKAILSALRNAYEAVESEDDSLFNNDLGKVNSTKVNAYLEPFGISAKDIRGFHANREMQERLRATRAKGGRLSEDKKERAKQLKAEFKSALEETAKAVGHESATLKSQYLVPGLEEAFLKDGTVMSKMLKDASAWPFMPIDEWPEDLASRVACRYLEATAGGPQVAINGRKYVLSDVWSAMGEIVEALGAGKPGGPRLIEPEIEEASDVLRKYRYLWVYNLDKPLVAMYRYSDGDEKCYGKPAHYMQDLQKAQQKNQLNRVSDREFRDIERWSRRKQDETLRHMKEFIEERKSDLQKKVDVLVHDWFDREFLPRIKAGWERLERGEEPAGFKINERLLPHFTEERQLRSYVADRVLKDFNEQAIEKFVSDEFGGLNMEDMLEDNQWAYWLHHEVLEQFHERFR